MNFLQLTGGPGGNLPRFGLATGIIHSYVNTTSGVRFAVMTFNRDRYGKIVLNNAGTEYTNTGDGDADGGRLLGFVDENKAGKETLFTALAGLKNDTWSPLAEALYSAGAYFRGQSDPFTGVSYTSPVQYYCQKNYVLIISDGVPTKDSDSRLAVADSDGDGSKLDDVAKYLYNIDMSGGQSLTKQNITTYTIGFSLTQPLLERDGTRTGAESTTMCGALRVSAWPFRSSSSRFSTSLFPTSLRLFRSARWRRRPPGTACTWPCSNRRSRVSGAGT